MIKKKNKISENVSFNKKLSNFSWFNLGGPAKIFFKPKNLDELVIFLKENKKSNKVKVLGAGSNVLIRDGGYDGVIVKFDRSFSNIAMSKEDEIVVGSSTLDKNLSNFALENSLSGFEFLSCIPGTIGGAIRMNSGCYGYDISKILTSVQAVDLKGNIKIFKRSDIEFFYRSSSLDENLIIIKASFKGKKDNKLNIKKKIETLVERKKNTQPSKIKTCGSTFKNPKNMYAWKLIRDSGCAGMKIGGAQISEKHCNFFVNNGNAKSKDLEELIEQVKNKVLNKTGVKLELELQIIGKS